MPDAKAKEFSLATRRDSIAQIKNQIFDITIIGGGITGAAIALEAAQAGYKTLLLEKGDFASGTSSRSTKLVHGGLRYLEQMDFALVFESLQERGKLLKLAPHLVEPEPILFPIFSNIPPNYLKLKLGLTLYDLLAFRYNIQKHKMMKRKEVLDYLPIIRSTNLKGAGIFYDCATNDSRLTLATIRTAHNKGAEPLNYCNVTHISAQRDLHELSFEDLISGETNTAKSRIVVSATGPWTDKLVNQFGQYSKRLHTSKGVHLVFSRKTLPIPHSMAITSPRDHRLMFVRPWDEDFVFAGTTDTSYSDDPDNVKTKDDDIDYILEALQYNFPSSKIHEEDVLGEWAGLRPLMTASNDELENSYKISREHFIWEVTPRFVAISGGKLTTHRYMAKDLMKNVNQIIARDFGEDSVLQPAKRDAPLLGSGSKASLDAFALDDRTKRHLYSHYGIESHQLLEEFADRSPLLSEFPHLASEIDYCIKYEMTTSLSDFFKRRTNLGYQIKQMDKQFINLVSQRFARLLKWEKNEEDRNKAELLTEFNSASINPYILSS